MHAALERLRVDVMNDESEFTHDGDEQTFVHMRNAVRRAGQVDPVTRVRRYNITKPTQHQKSTCPCRVFSRMRQLWIRSRSGEKPRTQRAKVRVWR